MTAEAAVHRAVCLPAATWTAHPRKRQHANKKALSTMWHYTKRPQHPVCIPVAHSYNNTTCSATSVWPDREDDGRGRGGDSQVMSAAPFGPSGHDVRCKRQLLALPLFLSCVLSLRSTDDGVDNVARWRWVQLGTLSVAFGRGRTGLLLLLLPWQRTRVIRPSLSFKGTGNFVTRGLFAATSTELSIL